MKDAEKIWIGVGKGGIELHHAYGLAGARETILPDLFLFLEKTLHMKAAGNPDMYVREMDRFTIDDARQVREIASRAPFSGRKVVILAFNAATTEAQNALLKTLEEPASRTHFFIVVPLLSALLPTVQSRLFVAESAEALSDKTKRRAEEFLDAAVPRRLAMAKDIAAEISASSLPRSFAPEFIGQLERTLWERRTERGMPSFVGNDLASCREYASDPSASIKMLLEHIAAILPARPRA